MINELLMSQEDEAEARRKEQLRKKGETFVRVFNYGPEGYNYIHAIDDIVLVPYENPETGRTDYNKKKTSGVLSFGKDRITQEMVADVLDTEFNRYFIARHLELNNRPFFVVENKKIAREIKALVNKPFTVEPTKKEMLRRKKVEVERELTKIRHEEEKQRKDERESEMATDGKIRDVKQKNGKDVQEQTVLDSPEKGV